VVTNDVTSDQVCKLCVKKYQLENYL